MQNNSNLEHFVRGLLTVIAFAVLGYVANATNLTNVVSPQIATIVAGLAASFLAMWDKSASPTGTVAFGSIRLN